MDNAKKPAQNEQPTASAKPAATSSAFSAKPGGPSVMQSFKENKKEGPSTAKVLIVMLVMAALGIGTGYGIAAFSAAPGQKSLVPNAINPNAPQKGQTFGVDDTAAYPDDAEGVLKEGGIEGEGQYHLERTGGESQNVYMTSSTVDLSKFVGQKVKVWGATQTAQHAGWLMDVGKVEVL
jgi:hypothetical protein